MIARPMADSAAATVSTKKTKTWPTRSPMKLENATRLMLTASSMISIDSRITMTFLRLRKMPTMPRVNRMAATVRKCPSPMVMPASLCIQAAYPRGLGEASQPVPMRISLPDVASGPPSSLRPGCRNDGLARWHLDDLDRSRGPAGDLGRDRLPLDACLVAQGEHDGADHGDEEDEAGALEVVGVLGIEDAPERRSVRDPGCGIRDRRGRKPREAARSDDREAHDHDELGQQDAADQGPQGSVLDEACLEGGKVDVQHHDDEQEQHGHRTDVDDDEQHGEEFSAEQQEQTGGVEIGEDQKQHGMNRVPGQDHHRRRENGERCKQVEEERGKGHCSRPDPPSATATRAPLLLLNDRLVMTPP